MKSENSRTYRGGVQAATISGAARRMGRSLVAVVAAPSAELGRVGQMREKRVGGNGSSGKVGGIWWNLWWVLFVGSDVMDVPERVRASSYPPKIWVGYGGCGSARTYRAGLRSPARSRFCDRAVHPDA